MVTHPRTHDVTRFTAARHRPPFSPARAKNSRVSGSIPGKVTKIARNDLGKYRHTSHAWNRHCEGGELCRARTSWGRNGNANRTYASFHRRVLRPGRAHLSA